MNYRHKYHAGNFADVVKHAVLALAIERLKQKDAAFRVIDTHAGIGDYDLRDEAAQRTGEWRGGIGRLIGPDADPLPPPVAALLKPYLDVVADLEENGGFTRYPGSPRIARALLRQQDKLVVNELHPEDLKQLARSFSREPAVKVMGLDGWTALKALLPPPERRGIVLVDPPFEEPGEFGRLTIALQEAVKRFATGVYMLWYPIKDPRQIDRFRRDLAATGLPKLLVAELWVRPGSDTNVLNGAGLAILNPPFELDRQLSVLGPFFAERLSLEPGGGWRLDWLRGES